MAETRNSQLICDAVREFGASLQLQIQALFAEQNTKFNKNITDLFNAATSERKADRISTIKHLFAIDHTPEKLKVGLDSLHVDSHAATSHRSVAQSELGQAAIRHWQVYKEPLKERFGEVLDDPIAELKTLQETAGIVEYHNKFELIRTRFTLSEEYLVSAYLAGLRSDMQMHIRIFQPKSIEQCFMLSRLYEQAHPKKSGFGIGQALKTTTSGPQKQGVLPMNKELELKKGQREKGKESAVAPRKLLTSEQVNERRAQGLYYFFDEMYTQNKRNQPYMIEGAGVNESEEDITETEVMEEEP